MKPQLELASRHRRALTTNVWPKMRPKRYFVVNIIKRKASKPEKNYREVSCHGDKAAAANKPGFFIGEASKIYGNAKNRQYRVFWRPAEVPSRGAAARKGGDLRASKSMPAIASASEGYGDDKATVAEM